MAEEISLRWWQEAKLQINMEKHNLHNLGHHGFEQEDRASHSYWIIMIKLQMWYKQTLSRNFTKVDHEVIAHKMKLLGITGKVGKCVCNFLRSSSKQCKV